jgi:hypothetical protein
VVDTIGFNDKTSVDHFRTATYGGPAGERGASRESKDLYGPALKAGKIDGMILMPLGLKLDCGAILSFDDKDLGQGSLEGQNNGMRGAMGCGPAFPPLRTYQVSRDSNLSKLSDPW